MKDSSAVDRWFKRISAAEDVKKNWEDRHRVPENYQFWAGNQLESPKDQRGDRKVQLNLVASAVRAFLPSVYFNVPKFKVSAAPEKADTPGEVVDAKAQLLQDTGNYLARDGAPSFREHTFLALKESEWAFGCVEVGYEANFIDNPNADRPALKEDGKESSAPIKDEDGLSVGPDSDLPALQAQLAQLQAGLESETFYVKHIPAKQVLISSSDKPVLEANDWIGYWEDHNLEDVKACKAYKNTKALKPSGRREGQKVEESDSQDREDPSQKVRLYRLWDLRTRRRHVLAQDNKAELLFGEDGKPGKPYERCPLKLLRPDVDPYHYFPKPPISNGLSPQEEYNDSREHLRKLRKATVPRYTYDDGAITPDQLQKLESDEIGTYIPRNAGSGDPILPVQQPNYAENALRTLTISEKEFNSLMSVPAEFRQSQEDKTATQATIQNTQAQVQNNFDRNQVAEWLGTIVEELINLAIEHMSIDRWVAINVDTDSPMAQPDAMVVAQLYQQISADKVKEATSGIRWKVNVDVSTMSPVSEEQKLAKWMQTLSLLVNPQTARLMALSPAILKITLDLNGIKNGREQDAIRDGLQKLVQLEMQMQAMQAGGGSPAAAKGIASQPGQPQRAPGPSAPQSLPEPPGPPPVAGA